MNILVEEERITAGDKVASHRNEQSFRVVTGLAYIRGNIDILTHLVKHSGVMSINTIKLDISACERVSSGEFRELAGHVSQLII